MVLNPASGGGACDFVWNFRLRPWRFADGDVQLCKLVCNSRVEAVAVGADFLLFETALFHVRQHALALLLF